MDETNCIFCKIAAGEIPSSTVYEDEFFRVILDIAPAAKGHVIILPKQHMTNLFDLSKEIASRALCLASHIANGMKKALCCDGVNLLQNNGAAAGQTVFHLHLHLIPRYENDHMNIPWKTLSYTHGEADRIAERIKNCCPPCCYVSKNKDICVQKE